MFFSSLTLMRPVSRALKSQTCRELLDQQNYDSLSKQEISVMRYILDGKDNNDIAEKMFISNKTVSTYKSRLMEKLECKSLMDLYTFAQRNKIG
ncbi:Two-component response regulator evgA [Shigella dysenteriae 1617]|uniref:Two-component response regulator evgA n=1 Tax=Shigella dysenteriae 1617 TaxID=754093 RepID=A0A0A6ZWJ0_SHIDY|nr:Two-component response regulator evgA [Shigella dysenteriae 1617]